MLFFTDDITQERLENGEQFGDARLVEVLECSAPFSLDVLEHGYVIGEQVR